MAQEALPEADPATRESVQAWLERFARCVRDVDYAAARPFWHAGIVTFGVHQTLGRGVSAWQLEQWNNVWPRTEGFRFLPEVTAVLAASDSAMAVAIAPWTSTGFHADGTPFDRPGRATLVLVRGGPEGWLGVHSHMSLLSGVPHESHGNRPVKAW